MAVEYFNELIKSEPNNLNFLMDRGSIFIKLEKFDDALKDFAQAVEKDHKNTKALSLFGAALIRCGRINEACEILEFALELAPENYEALINICTVYQSIGKSEEFLQVALKAVSLRPGDSIAYNNLGSALADINLIDDALEAYKTANVLSPEYAPTIINLAQLEIKKGNNKQGLSLYEKALMLENISPGEAELIKYYTSYSFLYEGQIDKGWSRYGYGFGALLPFGAKRSLRKFLKPKWRGEKGSNNTLLIWREQGLGDELEFSTCLLDIHNEYSFANVIVECDKRLINIFKRIFPKFIFREELIDSDGFSTKNDFDLHCAVGSLPEIFRNKIEEFSKYEMKFIVLPELKNKFQIRLNPYKNKTLVGICWRSGLLSIGRNSNYTVLDDWSTILTRSDLQFVNLQYGDCEIELQAIEYKLGIQVLRWTDVDLKDDLESVIAICEQLDFVASVGTAVVPLAGYSGVKTFLLAHKSWIMLGEEEKLPWCKNVQIILADNSESVSTCIQKLENLLIK